MRAKSGALVILAVCLVLAHRLALPAAAQTTLVRVWPAQASTTVGQVVELAVQVNDVAGLVGLDVRLTWDPTLLGLVDTDDQAPGAQALAGDLPLPDYVVRNFGDNEAGTLRYAVSQTSDHRPATGSGTAVTLRFQALAVGVCEITLVDAKLVDAQGDAIQAERAGAVVQVTAEQAGTPAPSATLGPDGYPAPEAEPSATLPQDAAPTPTTTSTAAATLAASPQATAAGITPTARPRRTATAVPEATTEEVPSPSTQVAPSETAAAPAAPAERATPFAEAPAPTAPGPLFPLIPSEWFVCLGIALLLGTLGLFLYLSRGGQVEPGRRRRTRLR